MSEINMDLAEHSISALLNYGVTVDDFRPWFEFAALTNLLTLRINGLIYLTFSRDWIFRSCDDTNVLDVDCQRKKVSFDDLKGYGIQLDSTDELPEFMVIQIHGGINLRIVCDSFEINLEPLSRKYPELL